MKKDGFGKTIKDFVSGIVEKKLILYAASGAYYIFIALVPVIMIVVSMLQFMPMTVDYVVGEINDFLPLQVAEILDTIIMDVYDNGATALTVSIVLAVILASAAMRAIMRGLDASYSGEKQPYPLYFLRSIFFMVIFFIVLGISLIIMALGGAIMHLIHSRMPDILWLNNLYGILRYGRYLVVWVIIFLVFMFMYKFIPVHSVKLKDQWPGSLLVAVGWVLFSFIFSTYLGYSNRFGAYGMIGTVMVAMVWLFYSIFIVLIGGWLNSFITQRKLERMLAQAAMEPEVIFVQQPLDSVGDAKSAGNSDAVEAEVKP